MDRDDLARRNQRMAAAIHKPSAKHHLRDIILTLLARAPVSPRAPDTNRLLIIRPDHLGDMLLTTPAIRAIKEARPALSIHVLCGDSGAELLAYFDEIDEVLTLRFPGFGRGAAADANAYVLALQSARKLRRVGYDCAIIMRPDHWWGGLLAKLAGIRQRIGYNLPGVAPFLTAAQRYEHQHAIEHNLRLAEAFTGIARRDEPQLDLPIRAQDHELVEAQLAECGIGSGARFICIHPGSGAISKIWRAEKWAMVADSLAQEMDAEIIFSGSAGEQAIIDAIGAKMNAGAISMAGKTSVGQLAALYRRALLVLGPDSGALHIAAAAHRPTVALFGPADPIEFAPWGDRQRQAVVTSPIACRPCRILDWRDDNPDLHPCVRDISVEQVVTAARRVLDYA